MLLIRINEQWRGIYFLGDHVSAIARGGKLCVIVLVYLGSSFVGLCRRVLVCVRPFIFLGLCRKRNFCHEVNDDLSEVIDLDADIPQEGASFPSSHDHDCFWVHFGQIEFHGKP